MAAFFRNITLRYIVGNCIELKHPVFISANVDSVPRSEQSFPHFGYRNAPNVERTGEVMMCPCALCTVTVGSNDSSHTGAKPGK